MELYKKKLSYLMLIGIVVPFVGINENGIQLFPFIVFFRNVNIFEIFMYIAYFFIWGKLIYNIITILIMERNGNYKDELILKSIMLNVLFLYLRMTDLKNVSYGIIIPIGWIGITIWLLIKLVDRRRDFFSKRLPYTTVIAMLVLLVIASLPMVLSTPHNEELPAESFWGVTYFFVYGIFAGLAYIIELISGYNDLETLWVFVFSAVIVISVVTLIWIFRIVLYSCLSSTKGNRMKIVLLCITNIVCIIGLNFYRQLYETNIQKYSWIFFVFSFFSILSSLLVICLRKKILCQPDDYNAGLHMKEVGK